MKKVFVMMLAVCAMSMSATVYAQEATTAQQEQKEAVNRRAAVMKKELNLSDEQVMQIKAADEKFELKRKNSRKEIKAAAEERDAEIKQVLTPEQQVKLEDMKKNHGDKKGFRPHQGKLKHREGMCAEKAGCKKHDMKCDSLRGKHHRGHMNKGHRHGDMKCDKAQGECQKMKDCDKKQDCPKMKGECQKGKCDKANGECPKMKDCDQKQACNQANGECQKGKCDKAQGNCPQEKK